MTTEITRADHAAFEAHLREWQTHVGPFWNRRWCVFNPNDMNSHNAPINISTDTGLLDAMELLYGKEIIPPSLALHSRQDIRAAWEAAVRKWKEEQQG